MIVVKLLRDIDKAGVSVASVCDRAGIDPSLISRWKHGRVEPRFSTIQRMMDALKEIKGDKK